MSKYTYFIALGLFGIHSAAAEPVPINEDNWELAGELHEIVTYRGQTAFHLAESYAALKGQIFSNGIIEFDIAFPEERGFHGIHFRAISGESSENFYFRPHQGGNPDANQYQPVYAGVAGWQLYYGPQYAAPTPYAHNEWQHVKILVKGDQAEFYLDSDDPFLHVDDLLTDVHEGRLYFSTGFSEFYLANINITHTDDIAFKGESVPHDPLSENLVQQFEVAGPFDYKALGNNLDSDGFNWQTYPVEANGIINLAKHVKIEESKRTALARFVIHSEVEQIKAMNYGYSDRVKVYVNGKLTAGGDNTYQSRDYRYLGTVGLFDTVYLHLEPGPNEVIFAVDETFGGWGVAAQLLDPEGIEF